MAKIQPQVNLARSKGATEIQVPAITNTVVKLSATTTTADTKVLGDIKASMLVRVAATGDCYIRYDSSATAATTADTLMIRGVEAMLVPFEATHISAIGTDLDVDVTITLYQ